MKAIVTFITLGTLQLSSWATNAECPYLIPRYAIMKVESCAGAIELVQSAIDGKGYTQQEASAVHDSSRRISIVTATPISEVAIILWYSSGAQYVYKGRTQHTANTKSRNYILLATSPEECKSSYLGKEHIFDVTSFPRCRDMIDDNMRETDPVRLLDLPPIAQFWGEQVIQDAPKTLLRNHP